MISTLFAMALTIAAQEAPKPALSCTKGPVPKTFGALPWLAYGCNDGTTVLLASPKDNPVSPFSFVLVKSASGYSVYGQGATGDKAASELADRNFRGMSQEQLQALATEANNAR